MKTCRWMATCVLLLGLTLRGNTQNVPIESKLKGIDATINKVLKDWNVPGAGVAIVVNDKLVFARGYGYRNLENKQPVTPATLFQIASNTKLFTATAIGFLVEEGKLEWDKPIKNYVPQIRFYNDELTNNVTIRDMLSHRTGISRHDGIWYNSDFTRTQLFDRLKYLEPSLPLRQGYLYNNMMYMAAGFVIEHITKQTWEEFVKERIFTPLGMSNSIFSTEEMIKQPDFMTPYYEKRDTTILIRYPYFTRQQGIGPAGSIITNLNELSHWLIAQMHGGKYKGNVVIPNSIIRETMRPAGLSASVPDKYFENLNSMYGMGRGTSSYKGHYRTQHTGAIGGIFSSVSFMPADSIGVIVYTNGAHAVQVPGIITNLLYDKLLGLEVTPWSERALTDYKKNKATDREARRKPDTDKVANTKPSHALADYAGRFEDAAYGMMEITHKNDELGFTFNHMSLPLQHYHYDRFISADDEIYGKWSMNFTTDAQGSIANVKVSLDEKEVVFTRKADARLTDPAFLKTLTGAYELNGNSVNIILSNNQLVIAIAPPLHLDPYKGTTFRIHEFTDQTVEFILDASGSATGMRVTSEGKAVVYTKKK